MHSVAATAEVDIKRTKGRSIDRRVSKAQAGAAMPAPPPTKIETPKAMFIVKASMPASRVKVMILGGF
jgi:hypothetical protein